jgi:hypothetical protein
VTGSNLDPEMQEITENLHRSELTALDRAEQVARWVELTAVKKELFSDNLSETKSKGRPPGAPVVLRGAEPSRLA